MLENLLMCGMVLSALGRIFKIIGLSLFISFLISKSLAIAASEFLVLCYHDIPRKASVWEDVSQDVFVKQLEYLKTSGYIIISPDDIMAAAAGLKTIPEKAILLTFDDAYLSFFEFVYPVLKIYNYPAILSVVTSWNDQKPDYLRDKELMSWKQIKEVVNSGLVYLASHTHELHKGVIYTPQGNIAAASNSFIYDLKAETYETEPSFRRKIKGDLKRSIEIIKTEMEIRPWILTWPYGEFNELGLEETKELGFKMALILEGGCASLNSLDRVIRNIVTKDMSISEFIERLKNKFKIDERIRAAQIDLDSIVNPSSYEESDYNLGLLIERLIKLGVNTVFIQGFCDKDGSGNIRSVYFQNRILPTEMDFLAHAVHQILIRGIRVYVWMPVLSFELPDKELNESLKVREFKDGEIKTTTSWYRRLSPFDKNTLKLVSAIYEDLAAKVGCDFDGILFQDDAYLTDYEDFHPEAVKVYREKLKINAISEIFEDDELKDKWTELKIETVDAIIQELQKVVKIYRPNAKFVRNIYSRVIFEPRAKEWFCQDFNRFLRNYDYTAIMAYPQMEKIYKMKQIKNWFNYLVEKVKDYHGGIDKSIFKVQTYDWSKNRWIKEDRLKKELRILLSSEARHIGYYPDNCFEDKPCIDNIASIVSAKYLFLGVK